MAEISLNTTILLRRDSAADWSSHNPVLKDGEIAYDLTNKRIKIGNNTNTWGDLGWAFPSIDLYRDNGVFFNNISVLSGPTSTLKIGNTGWEEYSSSYFTTSNTYLDVQLPQRSLYPGSRVNDCWLNVRAVRSGQYSSWVGPSWGFTRSGCIKVFDGSSWRNAAVWIYNGSKWIPAKYINIYENGGWKRSKLF